MRKLKHGKNAKKLAETVKQLLMPFKGKIKTITTDNSRRIVLCLAMASYCPGKGQCCAIVRQ